MSQAIDPWPAVVDVMYAPGLLYKPQPEDAERFAALAESGGKGESIKRKRE